MKELFGTPYQIVEFLITLLPVRRLVHIATNIMGNFTSRISLIVRAIIVPIIIKLLFLLQNIIAHIQFQMSVISIIIVII